MSGAIAYRMFLWTLPAALVVVSGLGFLSIGNQSDPARAVRDVGITSIPTNSINQAAHDSSRTWWLALPVGLALLYLASVALVKALWVAHALVWGIPGLKLKSKPRLAGTFLLVCLILAVGTSAAAVVRNASPTAGLFAMLADTFLYAAAWWLMSTQLPHAASPLTALIPGALAFAAGVQALHLVTVYYLAARATRASELYGTLGVAAALLLGLYFIGRLMIVSAELNAAIWASRVSLARSEGVEPPTF